MSALEALYQTEKSAPLAQVPLGDATPREDDVKLLARLIFAEAASNYWHPSAMAGVGWTVKNRVGAPGFPDTLEGVIYKPKQFAVGTRLWDAAANPASLTGPDARAYNRALETARGVLQGEIADPTKGARFFFSGKPGEDPPKGFFRDGLANETLEKSIEERLGDFTFVRERGR
jgi:spore germination cell wall hydrolase CwlJ-like protein